MSFTENRSAPGRSSIGIADLYGRVLVRKELAPGDWGKDVTFNLDRRKNNPDFTSGLFLKNPSIAGVFKIKMVKLFFHRY